MKVLITGAAGQVGRALQATAPSGLEVLPVSHSGTGADHHRLDIADSRAVADCMQRHQPDVIINAAAYTQVDAAEAEPKTAFAVNAAGAANLAQHGARHGARLIHLSTDFVFDGEQTTPYRPEDPVAPLGVYGVSKRQGEEEALELTGGEALVIRSAWIYAARGNNFVSTVLRLLRQRNELKIVADQTGTPTWAGSLAQAVWAAVSRPQLHGIYHWTDAGTASWYDFAVAIQDEAMSLGLLQKAVPIRPIGTADYPTAARRPRYSVLDCSASHRDFGMLPAHWRENLRAMLMETSK